MNHFAHAQVAAAHASDPVLALGAMWPDFAGWLREKRAEVEHPVLRAGAALHHASDAAFHRAPEFVALLSAGSAALRDAGLPRGPARAAAHVGLELLLDAELARDPQAADHYAQALLAAAQPELGSAIVWRRPESAQRWRALHLRLCAHGAPRPDEDADALARRVLRALSARPRLALCSAAQPPVSRWLGEVRPRMAKSAPALVERVVRDTQRRAGTPGGE